MVVEISMQLEVTANNKIVIPGCEPVSAMASMTLMRNQRCTQAMVDLAAALAAIPGSYIKLVPNYGAGNTRKKWFVFPPYNNNCPCDRRIDYYQILRDLPATEDEIVDSFDYCDVIGQGFCPSPDFAATPAPSPDPYVPEGSVRNLLFNGGVA